MTAGDNKVDYANGLDADAFEGLSEIVADQVVWDGVGLCDTSQKEITPADDFISVVTGIWGDDKTHNLGLKELTEVVDVIPSFEEEDSPQMKTPRMKASKSSNSQNSQFSLYSNVEQTPYTYPIPPPAFLIHRIINRNAPAPNHIQRLSLTFPALRFWEKMSYSPVSGEKDVRCYVVHPDCEGMTSAVDAVLSEIQTAWEASGMGKFERGKVGEGVKDGMIAIQLPQGADEEACLTGYQDALINFGILS
jgi:hypothetical protein